MSYVELSGIHGHVALQAAGSEAHKVGGDGYQEDYSMSDFQAKVMTVDRCCM